MAGATGRLAPPDLQAQAHRPVQGRHRAAVLVADRHPPPAVGAAAPNRPQHPLPLGPRPRLPTCHAHPLTYSSGEQRTANFAGLAFFALGWPFLRWFHELLEQHRPRIDVDEQALLAWLLC